MVERHSLCTSRDEQCNFRASYSAAILCGVCTRVVSMPIQECTALQFLCMRMRRRAAYMNLWTRGIERHTCF